MKYKPIYLFCLLLLLSGIFPVQSKAWGFFGHKKINRMAVFCLPPQMMVWYKSHIEYITDHAPDPDKRRYAVKEEGARHFIDIDYYRAYPFSDLPRRWQDAVEKYSEDTLQKYGVVPWYALKVFYNLQSAFKRKDARAILKYSTELGHYTADASVPLHATSNYDGQLTGQKGIHALWESEIPELFADTAFYLWTGKAEYINNPGKYIWDIVLESALAADSVLKVEKDLLNEFPKGDIHGYIDRNGKVVRSYSVAFAAAYNHRLKGMVEKRMRRAIRAVSSLWYTAWIDAGQPDLRKLGNTSVSQKTSDELKELDKKWHGAELKPEREHDK